MGENFEKKTALCKEVEELCNTTDWKNASPRLNAIHKEWREIGPTHKKHSNQVWERFTEACCNFYKARENGSSIKSEEHENLFRKKAILAKLKSFNPAKMTEDMKETVQALIDEWNNIGHVPFRVKDKLTSEFDSLFAALSEKLEIHKKNRKQIQRSNRTFKEQPTNMKEKLMRQYENLKNEIQTYENNLAAISTKSGNSFIDGILNNIEILKKEAEDILNKVRDLEINEEQE